MKEKAGMYVRTYALFILMTAGILTATAGCGGSSSATEAGAIPRNFLSMEDSKAVYSPDDKTMHVEAKLLVSDSGGNPVPDFPLTVEVDDASLTGSTSLTTDDSGTVKVIFTTSHLGDHRLNVLSSEGELMGSVIVPVGLGLRVKNLPELDYLSINTFKFAVQVCLSDDSGPLEGKAEAYIEGDSDLFELLSHSPSDLDGDGCTVLNIKSSVDGPVTISISPEGITPPLHAVVSPPHRILHAEIHDEMSQTAEYEIINPRIGLFTVDPLRFSQDNVPMSAIIMGEISSGALPNPVGDTKVELDLPNTVDPSYVTNIPPLGDLAIHFLIAYDDLNMNGTWNPDSEPLLGIQGTTMFLFKSDGWTGFEYRGLLTDGSPQYEYADIDTTLFSVFIRNARVNTAVFNVMLDEYDVNDTLTVSGITGGQTGVALYLVPLDVLGTPDPSSNDDDTTSGDYRDVLDEIVNSGILVGEAPLEFNENDSRYYAHIPMMHTDDLQAVISDAFIATISETVPFRLAFGMALMYHEDSEGRRSHWLLMHQNMGRTPLVFSYIAELDPVYPAYVTMAYMQHGVAGEQPDPSPHTYIHDGWTAIASAIDRKISNFHTENSNKIMELDESIYCGKVPGEEAWFEQKKGTTIKIYGKVSCYPARSDRHVSSSYLRYSVTECWKKDDSGWKLIPSSRSECNLTDSDIKIFDFNPMDKLMMFFRWESQTFDAWPVSSGTVGIINN